MNGRRALALGCLVIGVPLAAWGMAGGGAFAALLGLLLVMVFVGMAYAWIAGAQRPMGAEQPIRPATDVAWSMKDHPMTDPGDERRDPSAPGGAGGASECSAPAGTGKPAVRGSQDDAGH